MVGGELDTYWGVAYNYLGIIFLFAGVAGTELMGVSQWRKVERPLVSFTTTVRLGLVGAPGFAKNRSSHVVHPLLEQDPRPRCEVGH